MNRAACRMIALRVPGSNTNAVSKFTFPRWKEPSGRGKWASALRAATPSRDYSYRLGLHQASLALERQIAREFLQDYFNGLPIALTEPNVIVGGNQRQGILNDQADYCMT